jgi:hypothetical protein
VCSIVTAVRGAVHLAVTLESVEVDYRDTSGRNSSV